MNSLCPRTTDRPQPSRRTITRYHGPRERGPVRWRILGSVEAERDGQQLELGPPRQRAVLALLLAEGGAAVSMGAIAAALWPEGPPTWSANVVHRHIGALRRVVDPALPRRAQGEWLRSSARGYRIDVDADSLDLLRFRELAHRAGNTTEPRVCLDLLCQALALWRGSAAAGIDGVMRTDPAFTGLDQQHAAAALDAADLAMNLGRQRQVLPALQLAARTHPTDELLHGALMRCLASTGQRADALRIFDALRSTLVDDLGVSPGPALTNAYLDVLRDNVVSVERAMPALPPPAQLPAATPGFVGRDGERARLRADIARYAVLAVTGTAGVGKTSLALRLAHDIAADFPDGQLHADLQAVGGRASRPTVREILHRFLVALDVPEQKVPDGLDARAALYRSALARRRMLIVLDDAWDSAQVRRLLPGTPTCRTLVTSRSPLTHLGVEGYPVLQLKPFDLHTARELLNRRTATALDDDVVRELWSRSGGLPRRLAQLAWGSRRRFPAEVAYAQQPPPQQPPPRGAGALACPVIPASPSRRTVS